MKNLTTQFHKFPLLCRPLRYPILVFSLFMLGINQPANAQEKLLRTLTVTGEGVEKIATTRTQVQLGVEIQGKTAAQVQQEVAQRTAVIVELLRSYQVEELQTTGIGLQPNYDYNNNQRRLIGYVGTNTVSFLLNTEQVGALLDKAVNSGATRIDGLSFTATDTAIAAAQKLALQKATVEAQQQAEAVLKVLNLTAKDIVSIQINGANPPIPQPMVRESLAKMSADVSTPKEALPYLWW